MVGGTWAPPAGQMGASNGNGSSGGKDLNLARREPAAVRLRNLHSEGWKSPPSGSSGTGVRPCLSWHYTSAKAAECVLPAGSLIPQLSTLCLHSSPPLFTV